MEKSKIIIFGAGYYDNSDYAIEGGINLVIFLFGEKDENEYSNYNF
jgi:hypothetical protein